jgi:hypothetical protein
MRYIGNTPSLAKLLKSGVLSIKPAPKNQKARVSHQDEKVQESKEKKQNVSV